MPCETHFIDSSDLSGPFLNSKSSKDGLSFNKNCYFMGRSGVKVIQNLTVAFVSGVDPDLLGPEVSKAEPGEKYLGSYFA